MTEKITPAPKLRAGIILDNLSIKKWQREALASCLDLVDIELILNCRNTNLRRAYGKHFAYYVINLLCLKTDLTRSMAFLPNNSNVISFYSEYSKGWQKIPDELVNEINAKNIDLVIKFGMNLLIIPENLKSRFGVLSYHHGDPTKYRGRPAGFYEILNNEDRVGIIVQRLSNKLDGGDIYVKAFSKIWHHSYKKTAVNFYKNSIPLLRKAILSALNGEIESNSASGKIHTLPTNSQSLYFLFSLLKRKLSRIVYGAFFEKKWNILVSPCKDGSPTSTLAQDIRPSEGMVPSIDKRYTFYADPFFSPDGSKIYVEALNKMNGLGEIISLNKETGRVEENLLQGNHFSYPQSIGMDDAEYLFPEIANFASPHFLKLKHGIVSSYERVVGLESYRVFDATYFQTDNLHFIFASRPSDASDNLLLFYSESRLGPYSEHPMNPVVVDPTCARMAGSILREDGKLFRVGQNNSFGYGNRVWICEIRELTSSRYIEKKIREVGFEDNVCGPHTINFDKQSMVMDFYVDRFSLLSGYRRFVSLVRRKRAIVGFGELTYPLKQ